MVCRVGSAATFTPVNRPRMPGAMAPCPAGVTPCRTGERNQAAYRAGAPNRFRGVFGANVSSTSSSPPNLHELAHYWGVELPNTLFGRGYSGHWGVSSVRGALGGFDPATARCASGQALSTCVSGPGGGSVTLNLPQGAISDACRMQTGRTGLPWGDVWAPGDTVGYAPLELYLMGLVGRAEAGGPWYVLDGAGQTGATTWSGSRLRQVTIDDIVRETGAERTPLPMNERAFRTAVVVFSTTPVSDAWLANLERWSAILGNDATDPCLLSFQRATGDRATMSTVLGAQRVPGMPSGTAPTCPGGAP